MLNVQILYQCRFLNEYLNGCKVYLHSHWLRIYLMTKETFFIALWLLSCCENPHFLWNCKLLFITEVPGFIQPYGWFYETLYIFFKKTCNMPYENTRDDASDSLHNSGFEHFPLSSKISKLPINTVWTRSCVHVGVFLTSVASLCQAAVNSDTSGALSLLLILYGILSLGPCYCRRALSLQGLLFPGSRGHSMGTPQAEMLQCWGFWRTC